MRTAGYAWPWGQTWEIVFWFVAVWAALTLVLVVVCAIGGAAGEKESPGEGALIGLLYGAFLAVAMLVVCLIAVVWAGLVNIDEQKKTDRGLGDGPRPTRIDGRRVDGVTEMADNFPNVATKCVWDGWRAFVTSNGDHLAVVEDESCAFKNTGPSR